MNAHLALQAIRPLFASAMLLLTPSLMADQVRVRHTEGRIHGFLLLRDMDDKILASGGVTCVFRAMPISVPN